jgi:hypothetical protein
MVRDFYSDRVRGPRPRTKDEISSELWGGIQAFVERGLGTGLFAEDFPEQCPDGAGVYASDRQGFVQTVRAEIRGLDWPSANCVPPTLAVLDLVEFVYRHASQATEGRYHSFYRHHHLSFDRDAGRALVRESINRLFGRNGMVYELDASGRVIRFASAAVRKRLGNQLPATRDRLLDELLDTAVGKYLDPDPNVRREALEQLWGVFERAKTVLDPQKKRGAAALLAAAANGAAPEEAHLLASEMTALTGIGNAFRIRHHETAAVEPSGPLVDLLFARMYALIVRLHPALR